MLKQPGPVHHHFKDAKEELYGNPGLQRLFNRLPNGFKKGFGSTQRRLITGPGRKNWRGRDHALFCRNVLREMAGMAAEMAVSKDLARGGAASFSKNVEDLQ